MKIRKLVTAVVKFGLLLNGLSHAEESAPVERAPKEHNPGFTVQEDRIHPNSEGHWIIAQCLIAYFGDPVSAQLNATEELLDASRLTAITRRMRSYQKAIHAETHPKRPGVP